MVITPGTIQVYRKSLNPPSTEQVEWKEFLLALGNRLKFIDENDPELPKLITETKLLLFDLHQTINGKEKKINPVLDKLLDDLRAIVNSVAKQIRGAEDQQELIFKERTSEVEFFKKIIDLGNNLIDLAPQIGYYLSALPAIILNYHHLN